LQPGSSLKLLERYTSADHSEYFFNGLTQIELCSDARLSHHRLQQESRNAFHLCRVALNQHGGSEYNALNLSTGAHWSRTDINARFSGEHARSTISGLYSLNDGQYNDIHLDVQHLKPNCQSKQEFKGILLGKGRAVFDGRILVEKDAQKTDAQLSNKNLVMADDAEIDTKPQLEIYADDVKCSHGTTVGKLDQNQLFYLRSRGINENDATRMLCLGFADQLISNIDDQALHDFIHQHIVGLFDLTLASNHE
jgi:Fe-S cluster assembly protein SufD